MKAALGHRGSWRAECVSVSASPCRTFLPYFEICATGSFYVDKTGFVRDWWLEQDDVTLVCRPRRFGKTLNLDTVRCFLSTEYAGRGEELFGGLGVWEDPAMRALQGTVPVVAKLRDTSP